MARRDLVADAFVAFFEPLLRRQREQFAAEKARAIERVRENSRKWHRQYLIDQQEKR